MCAEGVGVDPDKVAALNSIDTTQINNVTAVRSFLGLANYYKRFVRGYSEICTPLNALCNKDADVATESQTPACQQAFQTIKESLMKRDLLKCNK